MSSSVVECSACGYLQSAADRTCARCGASLVDATVVAADDRQTSPPPYSNAVPPPAWSRPAPRPAPSGRFANLALIVVIAVIVVVIVGVGGWLLVKKRVATMVTDSDVRQYLTNQPDYQAEWEGKADTIPLRGVTIQSSGRMYMEFGMPRSQIFNDTKRSGLMNVGVIVKADKTATVIVPEVQMYGSMATPGTNEITSLRDDFNKVVSMPGVTIKEVGTDTVSGYDTKVIHIEESANSSNRIVCHVAPALKNLVVKYDGDFTLNGKTSRLSYVLKNVTFDIDESYFRVPVTYSEIRR